MSRAQSQDSRNLELIYQKDLEVLVQHKVQAHWDLKSEVNTTMSKIAQFTEQRERGKTKRQCANSVKTREDCTFGQAPGKAVMKTIEQDE